MASFSLPSIVTFILCLCWTSTCTFGLEQFMSGAVPIREPDNHHPLMYSSVIPLIYKFNLPVWDIHSMKIQFWKEHNNCTDSDTYEAGYPCPIIYHMNSLIESFASNITYWKNLFLRKDMPNEFLQDPSILWDKDVCTNLRIEPHFQGIQASSQQLQKYMDVLTQCAEINGTVFNQKIVDLKDSLINLENQYHDTFASFTADYWSKISNDAVKESTSVVAWTALEAALMIHQYAETQKWSHAIDSCKSQQIPWSLIDAESLEDMLISLKKNYLNDQSQDFAIDLENLSKYFTLPLTDCVFGNDNTFIARILIPVIPEEARNQNHFVRFHPIPFITEGKVCEHWEGRESIPFNLGLNGVLPCTCEPTDIFCKGWDTNSYEFCSSSSSLYGHEEICLHALTSDIEEDIIANCPLKCRNLEKSQSNHLDIIIKSDSQSTTKIIPTRVTKNLTFMECSSPEMAMEFRFEAAGAYELHIPADCSIMEVESGNSTFRNIVPEIQEVSIKHLMPYHWRNGITVEEEPSEADDTVIGSVQKLEGVEPKIAFLAGKLQRMEEMCGRSEGDTVLWGMISLSIVANICLGVMVLRLTRWKGEISKKSKSNDIPVYSIGEEDDFPIHEGMRNPLFPGSSRNGNGVHDE